MNTEVELVSANTLFEAGDVGLLDVTVLTASDVLAADRSALAHALRRLADDLADSGVMPVLAGFGNFAPTEPDQL